MAKNFSGFYKGINLKPVDSAPSLDGAPEDASYQVEGNLYVYTDKLKVYVEASIRTVATLDQTQTFTNKTLTSPVIDTSVSGTAFLDDDSFATASATTLASSESIKAYVDAQILTKDDAVEIGYDDTSASITAANVQAAIDAVDTNVTTNATNISNHLSDAIDAHDASAISNVAAGNIVATTVQAAIDELDGQDTTNATAISDHISDTLDAHDASAISIVDAGAIYGATEVETALQEVKSQSNASDINITTNANDIGTLQTFDADLGDTANGAGASKVAIEDSGTKYTATNVEAALAEVKTIADTNATSSADLATHIANATDAHDASAISNVAAGNIVATNLQAAIDELDGQDTTNATAISDHLSDAIDAHDASAISVLDTGANYTATEVEAALAEVKVIADTNATDITGKVSLTGDETVAGSKTFTDNIKFYDTDDTFGTIKGDTTTDSIILQSEGTNNTRVSSAAVSDVNPTGDVTVASGNNLGGGDSGDVTVQSGTSSTNDSGSVTIKTGIASSGTAGNVIISAPSVLINSSEAVTESKTQTLTNKTLTSPVIDTSVSGTAFLDDDTFATASATTLASSESIKAYVDASGGGGGAGGSTITRTQTSHGFTLLEGVYHNGTIWVQATADDAETVAVYCVSKVTDANNFEATKFGSITATAHGKTIGEYYFLSTSLAGSPTIVAPSTGFSNPLFYVEDANTVHMVVHRAVDVDAAATSPTTSGNGTLDIFYTEDFESTGAADATSGNNATYLTAGPFSGTLSDETTNPIAGTSSIKYTAHATTPVINDWFDFGSITLDDKQKATTIGVNCYADFTNFSTDAQFVVWDITNGKQLTSTTDVFTGGKERSRFTTSVYIPSTCNAISWGWFMTTLPIATEYFLCDDIELSTNPFVYKQLVDEEYYNGYEHTVADTNYVTFGIETSDLGKLVSNISTTHLEFEVLQECNISCTFNAYKTATTTNTQTLIVVNANEIKYNSRQGSAISDNVTATFRAKVGDIIEPKFYSGTLQTGRGAFSFTATATTEHVVTPATSVAPVRYTTATAQSVPHNSETIIDFNTASYDNNSLVTTGASWKYTTKKKGKYKVHSKIMLASSAAFGESEVLQIKLLKNGAAYSVIGRATGNDFSGTTYFASAGGSDTIDLDVDDYIHITAYQNSGSSINLHNESLYNHITVEPITPNLLAAIPTNYQNVNPNILINGDCRVEQRGLLPVTGVTGGYYMDRWQISTSGASIVADASLVTTNQPSGMSGSNSLYTESTSAGTVIGHLNNSQLVEDYALYSGKTVTFSAWIKSNSTNARVRINDGVSNTQGLGHSGGGGWEFLTVTHIVDSSNIALSCQCIIYDNGNVAITSGDYIEFTGAKLELGSEATEFVADSFGDSLRKCQRYADDICSDTPYGVSGAGFAISTTVARILIPVDMYDAPTLNTIITGSNFSLQDATITTPCTAIILASTYSNTRMIALECTVASGLVVNRTYQLRNENKTTNIIVVESEL